MTKEKKIFNIMHKESKITNTTEEMKREKEKEGNQGTYATNISGANKGIYEDFQG